MCSTARAAEKDAACQLLQAKYGLQQQQDAKTTTDYSGNPASNNAVPDAAAGEGGNQQDGSTTNGSDSCRKQHGFKIVDIDEEEAFINDIQKHNVECNCCMEHQEGKMKKMGFDMIDHWECSWCHKMIYQHSSQNAHWVTSSGKRAQSHLKSICWLQSPQTRMALVKPKHCNSWKELGFQAPHQDLGERCIPKFNMSFSTYLLSSLKQCHELVCSLLGTARVHRWYKFHRSVW